MQEKSPKHHRAIESKTIKIKSLNERFLIKEQLNLKDLRFSGVVIIKT